MNKPTVDQFRDWCADHYSLASAVCASQAFARLERECVDAYVRPIFDSFRFTIGKETRGADIGQPITDPARLYLCGDDELCKDYFHACDVAHRAHGFTGPAGHCPALVAEHLQCIAEGALLDAGAVFMGIDDGGRCRAWGENREKLLKLFLGACINSRNGKAA